MTDFRVIFASLRRFRNVRYPGWERQGVILRVKVCVKPKLAFLTVSFVDDVLCARAERTSKAFVYFLLLILTFHGSFVVIFFYRSQQTAVVLDDVLLSGIGFGL